MVIMVWCKNLFRALLVYKVQVLPVHWFPKRACWGYSWGYESKYGVQQCVFWKRKGVAKIDWSTLLMISSMECIIYWASNKSVHKHSTQQRFRCLGAFNVDGSPFLLFIINHNALTVLLEPASVVTALSSVPSKSWHWWSWQEHLSSVILWFTTCSCFHPTP